MLLPDGRDTGSRSRANAPISAKKHPKFSKKRVAPFLFYKFYKFRPDNILLINVKSGCKWGIQTERWGIQTVKWGIQTNTGID
jgi:hypothetical protein